MSDESPVPQLGHNQEDEFTLTTERETKEDFILAFKKPLPAPIILSPPRLRVTRAASAWTRELEDSELVPKRSARLAAKSKHRELKPGR